ncbi:MAG: nucleotide exchange factor GrpE [Dehalobacterium sp.]
MTIFEDAKEEKLEMDMPEDNVPEDNTTCNFTEEEKSAETGNGENINNMLEKLEGEKAELISLTQRLQADFENFRRRTRAEKEDLLQYASEGVITKLLPVLDNFERALSATKEREEGKGFLDGVEMIFRQFLQVLTSEGLQPVESVGCPFDPNCHEAVMQVDSDEAEKDTVLEELQKGYRLKGKLIRPSMVKVAK